MFCLVIIMINYFFPSDYFYKIEKKVDYLSVTYFSVRVWSRYQIKIQAPSKNIFRTESLTYVEKFSNYININ